MTQQIGVERLAMEVHRAWRDGMIAQGRDVSPERMEWDTLSDNDKMLDRYISMCLVKLVAASMDATTEAP